MIFENLRDDVRFGWRTLRKSPVFLSVSVLSLGVALGSVTTMFSIVDTVDLQDVPFSNPEQLVAVRETNPRTDPNCPGCPNVPHVALVMAWRQQVTSFAALEGLAPRSYVPAEDLEAPNIQGSAVTLGFFQLLGIRPYAGRGFTADDAKPGAPPVVLVTYDFWQSRFGGSPAAIGTSFSLVERVGRTLSAANAVRYTLIGVLPPGFEIGRAHV